MTLGEAVEKAQAVAQELLGDVTVASAERLLGAYVVTFSKPGLDPLDNPMFVVPDIGEVIVTQSPVQPYFGA